MTDAPSAELFARCRGGDAAASEAVFARYVERLTRLARGRLSRRLAARVDAEDVVQSAFRSFFVLAADGDVALRQSGDLWRLLARLTLRKVSRAARRHRAGCRSVERERPLDEAAGGGEGAALARGPTPADAVALLDELRVVLAPLGPVGRRIAELRLAGHDVEEIAAAVGRSGRTVRRALAALGEELERRLGPGSPAATGEGLPASVDFGDVVLRQQLGAGGMGKVYRALRKGSAVPVAVKVLRRPLRQNERVAARFLEEARLLARLRHAGIVAVHALGALPGGGHFLVMDLVEGSDLARQVAAGPVPVGSAVRWVIEAADAIGHAHERGVVHCDLKPSNLLLDQAGHIRVTDFGLARSLTGEGGWVAGGTAGYMAPEQADASLGAVGPRTDVHGLGAVLYALLAGRPPYAAEGAGIVPLAALRPGVPAGVAELCHRCLAARPGDRPASAGAVAAGLRCLVRDGEAGV